MDLKSEERRWAVWMVQARNFAKRESYTDAVARMKLVHRSVERALDAATDPHDRARLERHRLRASEQLEDLQARYDAWHSAIAARRQQTIDGAPEEMARPIPTATD